VTDWCVLTFPFGSNSPQVPNAPFWFCFGWLERVYLVIRIQAQKTALHKMVCNVFKAFCELFCSKLGHDAFPRAACAGSCTPT